MPSKSRSTRKPARETATRAARKPARAALTTRRAAIDVDAPRDLEQALRDDPLASQAYRAMPPSHRKSYVEFIEEAKRPETRVRRVQQALRMMAQWGAEHRRAKSAPGSARKR